MLINKAIRAVQQSTECHTRLQDITALLADIIRIWENFALGWILANSSTWFTGRTRSLLAKCVDRLNSTNYNYPSSLYKYFCISETDHKIYSFLACLNTMQLYDDKHSKLKCCRLAIFKNVLICLLTLFTPILSSTGLFALG